MKWVTKGLSPLSRLFAPITTVSHLASYKGIIFWKVAKFAAHKQGKMRISSRAPLKRLTDFAKMVCAEKMVKFLRGKLFGIKFAFTNI